MNAEIRSFFPVTQNYIYFNHAAVSPLPASVAPWSIALALLVGAGVGIVAGMYPASRAARLDPIAALRQE